MSADTVQIPGYEILRPLGSGGMSTVYLALQRSLERKVAVKVLRRGGDPGSDDARQSERRFLLEGRMMAKLPHRNIAAVYDILSNEAIAYIAMEYLGGGALTDRMREGIDLADAVSVIAQVAGALEFAHRHGVVHRDLKPANIMFRDTGTPVLTDFGIARYQDGSGMRLTQTGMLVGTPTYMSPEQINGVAVDGRADQYSLGILFYELLTGAPPFRGDTPIAVLMAHLTRPPAPLPQEFRSFQDVFDRMLAKDRDARYPNLLEFAEDLKSRLFGSNTLLMRLQLDPEQSSSEQLRALGFSTSTPGTGGLHEALAARPHETSGPRTIAASPPPASASAPGAPALPAAAKPVRKWARSVAAATLLAIIGGGIWVAVGGSGHRTLNADEQELVRMWIERAQNHINNGELVAAAADSDGSAFQYLQKVLQKDPGNARAQQLLGDIAGRLRSRAESALNKGNLAAAADLDAQGLQAAPDNGALKELHERIADAGARDAGKSAAGAGTAAPAAPPSREHLDKLVAGGLSAPDLRAAVGEFVQVHGSAPDDAGTLLLRARLLDAIGTQMQKSASTAEFDGWVALLDDQRSAFAGDPAWAALQQARAGWRARIVAAAAR
jgi:serine/threonine-protein kinase PpkA